MLPKEGVSTAWVVSDPHRVGVGWAAVTAHTACLFLGGELTDFSLGLGRCSLTQFFLYPSPVGEQMKQEGDSAAL